MSKPTTYAEALAATPKPVAAYPGFALTCYTPTVGLSARPRTIWLLLFEGVHVSTGSKADHLAVLGHAPTREAFMAVARKARA